MSLYDPYFSLSEPIDEDSNRMVIHNCNGGVNFRCESVVTSEVARLLNMALEEGMRRKSVQIKDCLGITS